MVNEHFLFNTINNCEFENGKVNFVRLFVFAEDKGKAKKIAKEYLESGKSGFAVKQVVGQDWRPSNSFICEEGTVMCSENAFK